MAETTFWIKFRAQLREVRKGYKEISRLQKALDKQRKGQVRFEEKAAAKQTTSIRKISREKERASRREMLAERTKSRSSERERRRVVRSQQQEGRAYQQNVARDRNRIRRADREVRRSIFGRAVSGTARAATFGAGGMIGMLVGGALSGYRNFQSGVGASRATVGLGIGNTAPTSVTAAQFKAGRQGSAGRGIKGQSFGYNAAETQAMMGKAARATGTDASSSILRGEAYGMPGGPLSSFMGTVRRGGTKFGGQGTWGGGTDAPRRQTHSNAQGKNELIKVMAKGFFTGLEQARMPEYFQAVQNLMEQQQTLTGGKVNTTAASNIMALLSTSGASGLKGARGGKVAAQLQQGIMKPGGGAAGQALIMQAFGFGKPGGTSSYYEARKFQQGGFGKQGEGLEKVMKEIVRQGANMQERSLMMEGVFGTNLDTNEKILKIYQDTATPLAERMKKVKSLTGTGKAWEKQLVDQMKINANELKESAKILNLSMRDGGTAAKGIQALEKMQREFFKRVMAWAPKVLSGISSIVGAVKSLRNIMGGDIESPKATSLFEEGTELKRKSDEAFAKGNYKKGKALLDQARDRQNRAARHAYGASQDTGYRNKDRKRRAREAQEGRFGSRAEQNRIKQMILGDLESPGWLGPDVVGGLMQKEGFRDKLSEASRKFHKHMPKRTGVRGSSAAENFYKNFSRQNRDKYKEIMKEMIPSQMRKKTSSINAPATGVQTAGAAPSFDLVAMVMQAIGLVGQGQNTGKMVVVTGSPRDNYHEDASTSVSRKRQGS